MKRLLCLLVSLLALTAYGCGGSSSSDPVFEGTPQVSGSIVLPEATDQIYTVYLDDDGDSTNGYVARYQHFCDCGMYVEFAFNGVAPGSYYLYAETKSEDGTRTFFGIYDPDTIVTDMPAEPNVVIAADGTYVFDFEIVEIPST